MSITPHRQEALFAKTVEGKIAMTVCILVNGATILMIA